MKYIIGIITTTLLLVGGWYVVSNNQETEESVNNNIGVETDTLSIVTSFYPLEFAIKEIVGELGTVTNIGAGTDPHDFEPTTQDMLTMQKADLVVLQGVDFEPWGDDAVAQLMADNVPVMLATDHIQLQERDNHHEEHEDEHDHEDEEAHEDDHEHEEEDEHDHGAYDPHTWLDPLLFSEMVNHIAEEIALIDPENADTYQENAQALTDKLAALHTEYTDTLTRCVLDEVIVSHNAFGYVAERYGFETHAIAGLSTQDTPSITTLAELKEEAEEGIGAILLEENNITAYGETLARETGLVTLRINPIAYVEPTGQDYIALMQQNLASFAEALQCNE